MMRGGYTTYNGESETGSVRKDGAAVRGGYTTYNGENETGSERLDGAAMRGGYTTYNDESEIESERLDGTAEVNSAAMKKTIISTNELCKTFAIGTIKQHVLKSLDIDIYTGDFTVIMGSSGAGKSTLLYALSGMDKPTSGKIVFNECDISNMSNDQLAVFRRKNCGFVFQQNLLLDNMSIMDNILACGLLVNSNKKQLVAQAKDLFLKVGLEENIWRKFPTQVSGGEAQRACIVRALINQPNVVFADEPTGSLNSASGRAVLDVMTGINNTGQSIIMVTHDLNSARRGNRIIYLQDGVVCGECILGLYSSEDKTRQEKLQQFLEKMGW